jgi:hypothetical protein
LKLVVLNATLENIQQLKGSCSWSSGHHNYYIELEKLRINWNEVWA